MISASSTLGRYNQVRRTFRVAYITLAVLGALLSALMLLFPSEMAIILVHTPESTQSVFALAPAVLLVCITSAYRGYIQGHADMRPTTVGQVLEVLVKVIVGLTLAEWLLHTGESVPMASAGAIFGVTAGALAALIYMAVKCRPYRALPDSADVPQSAGSTFARFVKIGVPITLGASVMSVITLLDTNLVNVRLLDAGLDGQLADTLYGSYSAMLTLYNLPAAFITPLTISVVPAISAAVARGTTPARARSPSPPCASPRSSPCPWAWASPSWPSPSSTCSIRTRTRSAPRCWCGWAWPPSSSAWR